MSEFGQTLIYIVVFLNMVVSLFVLLSAFTFLSQATKFLTEVNKHAEKWNTNRWL